MHVTLEIRPETNDQALGTVCFWFYVFVGGRQKIKTLPQQSTLISLKLVSYKIYVYTYVSHMQMHMQIYAYNMYTYNIHLHTTYKQKAVPVKTSGRTSEDKSNAALTRTGEASSFCFAGLAAYIQSLASTQHARLASQSFAAC